MTYIFMLTVRPWLLHECLLSLVCQVIIRVQIFTPMTTMLFSCCVDQIVSLIDRSWRNWCVCVFVYPFDSIHSDINPTGKQEICSGTVVSSRRRSLRRNKQNTCVPMPAIKPIASSHAHTHDANGPHRGPAKWAAQK
jgi:hypothetical protein